MESERHSPNGVVECRECPEGDEAIHVELSLKETLSCFDMKMPPKEKYYYGAEKGKYIHAQVNPSKHDAYHHIPKHHREYRERKGKGPQKSLLECSEFICS